MRPESILFVATPHTFNPDDPLSAGRAKVRHVGLKPDLQSIDFVGTAPANDQSGFNFTF